MMLSLLLLQGQRIVDKRKAFDLVYCMFLIVTIHSLLHTAATTIRENDDDIVKNGNAVDTLTSSIGSTTSSKYNSIDSFVDDTTGSTSAISSGQLSVFDNGNKEESILSSHQSMSTSSIRRRTTHCEKYCGLPLFYVDCESEGWEYYWSNFDYYYDYGCDRQICCSMDVDDCCYYGGVVPVPQPKPKPVPVPVPQPKPKPVPQPRPVPVPVPVPIPIPVPVPVPVPQQQQPINQPTTETTQQEIARDNNPSTISTGTAIGIVVVIILLIAIGFILLYNKQKNTNTTVDNSTTQTKKKKETSITVDNTPDATQQQLNIINKKQNTIHDVNNVNDCYIPNNFKIDDNISAMTEDIYSKSFLPPKIQQQQQQQQRQRKPVQNIITFQDDISAITDDIFSKSYIHSKANVRGRSDVSMDDNGIPIVSGSVVTGTTGIPTRYASSSSNMLGKLQEFENDDISEF